MAQIIINGKHYSGTSVRVTNNGNTIVIDGDNISIGDDTKKVDIQVIGDIVHLEAGSGNTSVSGNVSKLSSGSGDVIITGNVEGHVSTGSGDVNCNNIHGDCRTGSGNVYHKK